jgi:bifunctional DNase/RNase
MAQEIIAKARSAGITISEADARKIIEEARTHPREIKQAYDMLHDAFEELKTTVPR